METRTQHKTFSSNSNYSCKQFLIFPPQDNRLKQDQDIVPCNHSKRKLNQLDLSNVLTYTRNPGYFVQAGDTTRLTEDLMNTMHKIATIATMAIFLAGTEDVFKAVFQGGSLLTTTGRDAALFRVADVANLMLPKNPFNNDEGESSFIAHYGNDSFLSLDTNPTDGRPDNFEVVSLPNFSQFAQNVRASRFTLAQWPLLVGELNKKYLSKGDFVGSDPTVETVEVKDDFVLPQVQHQLQAVEFPGTEITKIVAQMMKGIDNNEVEKRM